MNLPLPQWCPQDCFEKIKAIGSTMFDLYSFDRELAKLVIGPTMEIFLRNIKDEKSNIKIYLYSAHDTNLSVITRGLHLYGLPVLTDYGSAIIVEKLRDKKNNVYIRVKYYYL